MLNTPIIIYSLYDMTPLSITVSSEASPQTTTENKGECFLSVVTSRYRDYTAREPSLANAAQQIFFKKWSCLNLNCVATLYHNKAEYQCWAYKKN